MDTPESLSDSRDRLENDNYFNSQPMDHLLRFFLNRKNRSFEIRLSNRLKVR